MANMDKSKWNECECCGKKIPPLIRIYHICIDCLVGKKSKK